MTGNVLYLVGSSGSIHALDTRTGSPLWSTTTRLRTTLAPLVDGSTLIVAAATGTLTALDTMSGEERWRRRAPGGFVAQPFLAGDHLYAAHRAGRMLMCDIGNGQLRCSYELMWDPSRQGEPVFADGILFVTSGRGDIHALALV
ncbi:MULTISPECIES: PQQ-binding-like beta-propeller repeat protein [unclassified Kitasatospora]|uniref:PQQ-binding-like beta-propeller repeat protein n=1 Tax=unclassified Kitasatospora TaxID=2633591 RepID=UPI00382233C4